MLTIRRGLETVRDRIARAAESAGRDPADVRLVAVSKAFPPQAVRDAAACDQRAFGENYAQEGVDKIAAVEALLREAQDRPGSQRASPRTSATSPFAQQHPPFSLEWHFIGPIQSNKTKLLAQHFHWVQSLDRVRVAERLAHQRPPGLEPLQICIQVNVSGEATKSGVEPHAVAELAQRVAVLPGLRLRGLMTIPEPTSDAQSLRRQFRMLRELRDDLAAHGFALDTLSMGMSDDFEVAIAEGATMVRIGRAIFGDRPLRPRTSVL
ncbi:MAG TPA: YggS family pyridoxal phosphate-dependent enzyme [Burkholderiales bacterium]|nr:YggS family pyridoxal phosphate-dependent enzyme [Burkholderiales bacterium]